MSTRLHDRLQSSGSLPRFVRLLPPSNAYVMPENHSVIEWLADYMCPSCGMAGHWRSGMHFDHEMRCFNGCDPAPVWEPGLAYKKLVSHEPNEKLTQDARP